MPASNVADNTTTASTLRVRRDRASIDETTGEPRRSSFEMLTLRMSSFRHFRLCPLGTRHMIFMCAGRRYHASRAPGNRTQPILQIFLQACPPPTRAPRPRRRNRAQFEPCRVPRVAPNAGVVRRACSTTAVMPVGRRSQDRRRGGSQGSTCRFLFSGPPMPGPWSSQIRWRTIGARRSLGTPRAASATAAVRAPSAVLLM